MNKTLKITGITTGVFLLATAGASAATVTVGAHSTQGTGNQAHIFGAEYSAYTNGGASWSNDPTWTPPPGSQSGFSKSPFDKTPFENSQDYFSAIGTGAPGTGGGAASPVTLTFGKTQTAFNMLWGSIDSYNKIEFSLNGATQLSQDGDDIIGIVGSGGTSPNYEEVAIVKFSDLSFDSVTFSSLKGKNSFEFALAPVPLPAAGWLMIAGLGGLAAMRRRKKSA